MVERGETRPDRQRTREFIVASGRCERYGTRGDCANELVVAHLNLVRFLAMKFVNRGEPLDDLVQVGTRRPAQGDRSFRLERGVEFTTYATPTIVGEIKRYFRDKGWAVKVPRRLQELNHAVNRSDRELTIELGRSPTVAELAEQLSASGRRNARSPGARASLQPALARLRKSAATATRSRRRWRIRRHDRRGLELLEDRANLERAFDVLTGRERVIIYLRFYETVSQTEIAARLNVSQMHVSRLQAKALEKLRGALAD